MATVVVGATFLVVAVVAFVPVLAGAVVATLVAGGVLVLEVSATDEEVSGTDEEVVV